MSAPRKKAAKKARSTRAGRPMHLSFNVDGQLIGEIAAEYLPGVTRDMGIQIG